MSINVQYSVFSIQYSDSVRTGRSCRWNLRIRHKSPTV